MLPNVTNGNGQMGKCICVRSRCVTKIQFLLIDSAYLTTRSQATKNVELATLAKSHMGEKGTSIRIETCQLRPPLRLLCTKQEDPVRIVMWIITCNKTPFRSSFYNPKFLSPFPNERFYFVFGLRNF